MKASNCIVNCWSMLVPLTVSKVVSTCDCKLVVHEYLWLLQCVCCLGALDGDVILTEQDLHILTKILRPAAPQWKAVGLAIGFPNHELAILECNPLLISEGVTGFFRDMLSQWLKWAPPNHPSPTLEGLVPALQGSGHEDLVVQLRRTFLQKKCKTVYV